MQRVLDCLNRIKGENVTMQGKKFTQKMALFKKKMNDDVKYLNDIKIELDLLRSQ